MDKGYLKLYRSAFNHWTWDEDRKFSKFEAWLFIIKEARFKDCTILDGFTMVDVNRGQLYVSVSFLARAWNWSKSQVQRFLEVLVQDGMITTEKHKISKQNIITVSNYEFYNGEDIDDVEAIKSERKKSKAPAKKTKVKKDAYIDDGMTESLALDNGNIVQIPSIAAKAKSDIICSSEDIKKLIERLSSEDLIENKDIELISFELRMKYVDQFIVYISNENEIEGRTKNDVIKHYNNWVISRFRSEKKNKINSSNNGKTYNSKYDADAEGRRETLLRQAAEAVRASGTEKIGDNPPSWL